LRKQIQELVRDTSNNDGLCLYIAFSYGGRQEIVSACKRIVAQKIKEDEITCENFSDFLYSKNMPDVDIMIRTGGDMRISNFLLWQSSYAELFFFDKYWPDFNEESFVSVIESYQDRKRTFGIRK
jgi:undecaprenyl diphosphate synthase